MSCVGGSEHGTVGGRAEVPLPDTFVIGQITREISRFTTMSSLQGNHATVLLLSAGEGEL